jgi:corrinoid protein of di/trimethylamine methyltransferase
MTRSILLNTLRQAVVEGNSESAVAEAKKWLEIDGSNPMEAIEKGLTPGILEVGRLYDSGEYFLPELITSAEAMKSALSIFRPAITADAGTLEKGKVLMATVEGDIHEIGKSIVSSMLETRGFRVFDLGADVKLETLAKQIQELKPDVVGLSALLTTTMVNQKRAIETIRERGVLVKFIVGGAPVTRKWARQIGADGYGKDAFEAVEVVENLLKNNAR